MKTDLTPDYVINTINKLEYELFITKNNPGNHLFMIIVEDEIITKVNYEKS